MFNHNGTAASLGRRRTGVAVLTVVLLLTGCGSMSAVGEIDPAAPPTTTTSESPPAQSTPRPEASRTRSPAADSVSAELERRYDARLGVYAVDTGWGREVSHRAGERFAYASTIKALAAAAVLKQSSTADLRRTVTYDKSELVPHSPSPSGTWTRA